MSPRDNKEANDDAVDVTFYTSDTAPMQNLPQYVIGLASVLALSVTTGCAAGTKFDPADIPKLKVCESHGKDAEQLFGEPYHTGNEGGLQLRRWTYATLSKGESLTVATDSNDTIVDVAHNPSPSYEVRNRCEDTGKGGEPEPSGDASKEEAGGDDDTDAESEE